MKCRFCSANYLKTILTVGFSTFRVVQQMLTSQAILKHKTSRNGLDTARNIKNDKWSRKSALCKDPRIREVTVWVITPTSPFPIHFYPFPAHFCFFLLVSYFTKCFAMFVKIEIHLHDVMRLMLKWVRESFLENHGYLNSLALRVPLVSKITFQVSGMIKPGIEKQT